MYPTWMGTANLVLGVVSLVRLAAEVLFFWTWHERRTLGCFAVFDGTVATFWTLSGQFLRTRHPWAGTMTGMAAGAAAARSILSVTLLFPSMGMFLWNHREDLDSFHQASAISSRFLHYGIELLYWPFVFFLLLRACNAPRQRWELDQHFSTSCAFALSAILGAIAQAALLSPRL